jgi:MFS family permease
VASQVDGRPSEPTSGPAMFHAFTDPRYRLLWLAGLCVNVARWMDTLVLGWLVLELTGSPFLVGVAAFCRMAPMMVLGLFAGVLVDRFNRARLMILVQALNLACAVALALLFGSGSGSYWHLLAIEALFGISWVIDFPNRRTLLYTLVGPGRLANAISLETLSMQGSKIAGPVLGGVMLANLGPAPCYVVLAGLYVAALLLLSLLGRRVTFPATATSESVIASLRAGVRDVWAQPAILAVLGITVLMNMLVFPYQQMLPVFARDVLMVGPELLGLLLAADGLGALAGSLWVASRRSFSAHRQVFAAGSLAAATLIICLSFSPWYLLALPIQFLIGIGESGFGTMQSTIILLAAPERVRGRAMGILSACIGTQPLGTLWLGYAAGQFGAPLATATCAALGLILMLPVALKMMATASARPLQATSGT